MKVSNAGIVTRVYKSASDLWCVEIERTKTPTKGTIRYIGIKSKPKVKVGQHINAGDEI
jgi:biotin carboxyl carrier protein